MIQKILRDPERNGWRPEVLLVCTFLVLALVPIAELAAQTTGRDPLASVVQVSATIRADGRTADTLGTEREGSGVVIDDSGLILTIGYLILEALEVNVAGAGAAPVAADIVAYDHESGFGLLRAREPLDIAPLALGDSATLEARQPVLVASRVGEFDAGGVYVVDRRTFAGYWEYLLEDAIFTAPPRADFGGAALIDEGGRLVGIGSLVVNDAGQRGRPIPGNMFVPINQLKPILGDLLANGRPSPNVWACRSGTKPKSGCGAKCGCAAGWIWRRRNCSCRRATIPICDWSLAAQVLRWARSNRACERTEREP
jgi:S1-C subfamily serine protease